MNQLAITLCILMEAVLIMAKTQRLPPSNNNNNELLNKIAIFGTSDYNPEEPSNKPLYRYSYNTDTGIQAEMEGYLNYINTEQEALEVRGNYSYCSTTDAVGNTFQISYVANENGFQPKGSHLPALPPLIKKALQYIAEHPEESRKK